MQTEFLMMRYKNMQSDQRPADFGVSHKEIIMSKKCNPFSDSKFKEFEFSKSDMTESIFNGVNLFESTFWGVLKNARFSDSNLESSTFDDVNLSNSTYENVNLGDSIFHNINLSGVSFSNLDMSNTEINNANIEGLKIHGILVTDLFERMEKIANNRIKSDSVNLSSMESFFHLFKAERYHKNQYFTEKELRAVIIEYVGFYNNRRLHSSLNYITPGQYEVSFSQ